MNKGIFEPQVSQVLQTTFENPFNINYFAGPVLELYYH